MSDIITRNSTGSPTIANLLAVGVDYTSGQTVEHIYHPKVNSSGYNITYKPVRLRSGTIRLGFATVAHAHAAIALLIGPYTFSWDAELDPALDMTFGIAPGNLTPEPVAEDIAAWQVVVPFQEVDA